MTWYALLSVGVLCFGLFLWARIIHGRTAGVAAALLASCVSPLVYLSRDLSFLPVKNACWVLTAACVAALFRYGKSWKPALITGLVCGLSFQFHPRGVVVGFALLGAAIFATLLRAGTVPKGLIRLALLLVPLASSWFAMSYTFPQNFSLVSQVFDASEDGARFAELKTEFLSLHKKAIERQGLKNIPNSTFRWGVNSPGEMVTMFRQLWVISRALPARMLDHPLFVKARQDWVLVWLPGFVLALLISYWRLRKRPWQLIALLATGAPFALLAWSAVKVLPHLRFFTYSAALVPLLLGVGFGAALEHSRPTPRYTGWRRIPLVSPIALFALAITILLSGPIFLWSTTCVLSDSSPESDLIQIYAGEPLPDEPTEALCPTLLLKELSQGIDIQPQLYGKNGLIRRKPL